MEAFLPLTLATLSFSDTYSEGMDVSLQQVRDSHIAAMLRSLTGWWFQA